MVEGEGFEPSKHEAADLQSAGFDRSPTPPGLICYYQLRNLLVNTYIILYIWNILLMEENYF